MDEQWLMAMGLSYNAVAALTMRDRLDPATVDGAIRAWSDLAG